MQRAWVWGRIVRGGLQGRVGGVARGVAWDVGGPYPFEEIHADNPKDDKDEEGEETDVAEGRQRGEDGADEHGHPRDALERAQRAHGSH